MLYTSIVYNDKFLPCSQKGLDRKLKMLAEERVTMERQINQLTPDIEQVCFTTTCNVLQF